MFDNHTLELDTHETRIVIGFPGVGKTTFFEQNRQLKCADSDSSRFSWIERDVRNPDFPQNYIEHIKAAIGRFDLIFVSSHDLVREALKEEGLPFTVVYPSKELKDEYIQRYIDRGNRDSFVDFLQTNFEQFISVIEQDNYPLNIALQSGHFLSDAIPTILEQGKPANDLSS